MVTHPKTCCHPGDPSHPEPIHLPIWKRRINQGLDFLIHFLSRLKFKSI